MLQSLQARIEEDGTVRLLETVHIHGTHRAIVTILDKSVEQDTGTAPAVNERGEVGSSNQRIIRETSGLWKMRHGDGLEYVRALRSEWDRS